MYHKTLAEELKSDELQKSSTDTAASKKEIRVLNWAPGPMDTDMTQSMIASDTLQPSTQKFFASMRDENKFVDKAESATKLYGILKLDTYESGSHIDIYDEVEGL